MRAKRFTIILVVFVVGSILLLHPSRLALPPDPSPYSLVSTLPPSEPTEPPQTPTPTLETFTETLFTYKPTPIQIEPPTPPPHNTTFAPTPKPKPPPIPAPDLRLESLYKKPLADLCAATVWQPNLYLSCNNIHMGTFNAVNRLQVCIRWAIDLGAGFILPILNTRGAKLSHIFAKTNTEVGLDYLMDDIYLWESLKVNCPNMTVRKQSDLGKVNVVDGVEFVFLDSYKRGEYLTKTMDIISERNLPSDVPIVVYQKESICGWSRRVEALELQIAYRNIFRFNPVLVALGNSVASKLPASYSGVHLRLEDDAPWFKNKDEGMDQFLALLLLNATNPTSQPTNQNTTIGTNLQPMKQNTTIGNNQVVFVACGDDTQLARFAEKCLAKGVKVIHKWTFLTGEERAYVHSLAFDQIAIIDRIALESANYFYGVAASSFSYMLAQERHLRQTGNMEFRVRQDKQQYLLGIEGDVFYGIMW